MGRNDMIEVEDLEFRREAGAAIIVEYDGEEVSLPQSQIEWPEDAACGDLITVTMPEWLAMDRGLI
ncbi:hypothetical protein [Solidesulfovibrio sp.]|uniref:hypothetical protein n=1 Tax=Solidesulfovibrio sp. TaxID=2910990 RepID=UPI00260B2CAD|nr:hypothetical protein [Solidesulfovibrio sp.]